MSTTLRGIKAPEAFVELGGRGALKFPGVKLFKERQKCRNAIEAVIRHMQNDGWFRRNYLKGEGGDAKPAILCGVGHNIRFIL